MTPILSWISLTPEGLGVMVAFLFSLVCLILYEVTGVARTILKILLVISGAILILTIVVYLINTYGLCGAGKVLTFDGCQIGGGMT